jgi:hypothetical protein
MPGAGNTFSNVVGLPAGTHFNQEPRKSPMRSLELRSTCRRSIRVTHWWLAAFGLVFGLWQACRAEEGTLPGAGPDNVRVKAKAFLSVKKLPAGSDCEIIVLLTIQPGWHINSHSVVKEWQIPTELTVSSKYGTQLARVSYPKGRLARVPGSEEPVPVYERQATIRAVLTVPREAAGQNEEFRIHVKYQACNDQECEQPKVLKLAGKVHVAGDGEPVEEANSNLFPKSR